jgi:hypothetical protein
VCEVKSVKNYIILVEDNGPYGMVHHDNSSVGDSQKSKIGG